MPALSISVDSSVIATVCTDGYDIVDVLVGGAVVNETPATLDVFGGRYPEQGPTTHLSWVFEYPIHAGSVVSVRFLESGTSSHAGKTSEELFPDDLSPTDSEFVTTTEIVASLRAKPKRFEPISFALESLAGSRFVGGMSQDDHGFLFSVMWNSRAPDNASVSVSSHTLEQMEAGMPSKNHVQQGMACGDWVRFSLTTQRLPE